MDRAFIPERRAELARLQQELPAAQAQYRDAQAKAQGAHSRSVRAAKAKQTANTLFAIKKRILELLAANDH
jgi:hypothetical protein